MTTLNQINQDEINNILWKACDTFRGTIDPSEYKNYILVMLFVKYISDVWRDRYAALLAQHNGDENRVRRQLRYEKFVLPEGCDYETLYDQRNAPNLGELINIALEQVEDANKEKLGRGVPQHRLQQRGQPGTHQTAQRTAEKSAGGFS